MMLATRWADSVRSGLFLLVASVLLVSCGARSNMGLTGYEDGGVPGEGGVSDTGPGDGPADVVYDHVNDINGCNPSTCGGCCDESGTCLTGLAVDACGIGGYQCVDCSDFGAACNASSHQCGPATECSPSNCPSGCCDANGGCTSGTDSWACGASGQKCVACPSGSWCDADYKQCVASQQCGPWNCGGCCDYWGNCNWGGDSYACGVGGGICNDCASSGMQCDMNTYQCTTYQECGPWNCGGCCDPYSGACQWGGDEWACGIGGNICDDCWSYGMTCDQYMMQCVPVQDDCGPWNCGGCCDYNYYPPQCMPGYDSWACGWGGNSCEDCTYSGGNCDPGAGACTFVPKCGPDNCKGCCDPYSDECRLGWDPWACGTDGQICQDCNGPQQSCAPSSSGGGGLCISTNPTCGPSNCNGCCDCFDPSYCQCVPGFDPWSCGHGGQICQYCADPNQMCQDSPYGGGQCVGIQPPQDCGPWNCNGCCDYNSYPPTCMHGDLDWACGAYGEMCLSCGYNESCIPMPGAGGQCEGEPPPPDCGPWNCNGCCNYNSYPPTCMSGYDQWACGNSGNTCQPCYAGQVCQSTPWGGGMCGGSYPDAGPPPPVDGGMACGSWNCAGCCTPNGDCRPGTSNNRCGVGGEMCENCAMQNLTCQAGNCY